MVVTSSNQSGERIRVLVVEDQRTLADSLVVALSGQPDIRSVEASFTAADAMRRAILEPPDVMILDLGLPDERGLSLCRRLRLEFPGLRVVVLTGEPRPEDITEAAELGVAAFLSKGVTLNALLAAVRGDTQGAFTVDPVLLLDLARRQLPPDSVHNLTRRETEILDLMSRGVDARGIARELNLSPHTARDYIKVIYRKLNAHSQLEAVLTAFRSGELDLGA